MGLGGQQRAAVGLLYAEVGYSGSLRTLGLQQATAGRSGLHGATTGYDGVWWVTTGRGELPSAATG
jgi:hypothetical protein